MLTDSEWDLIIELLQVLGPIEEVTTCLGGSNYTTHSLLYWLIQGLKKRFKLYKVSNNELDFNTECDDVFENNEFDNIESENQEEYSDEDGQQTQKVKINTPVNTNNLLNQVKKNMYKALCYYYPTPSSEQLLSALLDPRCKKLEFVDFSTRLDVENKLRELYEEKKALEDEGEERENQTQENDIDEYSNVLVNLLYTPSLLKSLDKEEVANDEVEEYLNLSQIGIKKDPLAWWDLHSTKFPILSELSKIYLAVPATSTPS